MGKEENLQIDKWDRKIHPWYILSTFCKSSDIWRKDSLWSIKGNRLQRTDQICTLGNIEKNVFEMCLFVSNNQRALLAKWNYLTDFAIISTKLVEVVWSNYITLRTILRSWMDCTSKMSERDKCLLNMNLRHYNQGGNKFNRPQKTVRILTVQQYSALTIWGKFSFKAILSNWALL